MIGYASGIIVIIIGLIFKDPLIINLGLFFFLLIYIAINTASGSIQKIVNPIFLFCVGKLLTTIGNLLGVYFADDVEYKWKYWYYANEEYLYDAATIHALGTLMMLWGFSYSYPKKISQKFPKLNFQFNPIWLERYDAYIWIIILLNEASILVLPVSGHILHLIFSLLIFLYSYQSQKNERKNFYFTRAYLLVLILTVNAYLHSFLRIDSINPSILFIIGLIWGAEKISILKSTKLIPLYIFLFIFSLSFNKLGGDNRQNVEVKNEILLNTFTNLFNPDYSDDEDLYSDPESDTKSIWGRISNFNQLTKVVEVQVKDGFYYGSTFSYLTYAWIPRVLWPDKPKIAAGSWFALTANLAYINEDGVINNSIDMTPTGELYLNFGHPGIIIGGFLLGLFWASLWRSANFYAGLNLTGIMFGVYLLNQGYFQLGADLQVIVTALSVFVIVYIFDKILNTFFP